MSMAPLFMSMATTLYEHGPTLYENGHTLYEDGHTLNIGAMATLFLQPVDPQVEGLDSHCVCVWEGREAHNTRL
jgi:hypothetical protein